MAAPCSPPPRNASIVPARPPLGKTTQGLALIRALGESGRQIEAAKAAGGGAEMATIDDILSAIDADQAAALDRLFAFLSIPSISAVPAHFPDCERAADWLVAELGATWIRGGQAPDRRAADGRRRCQGQSPRRAACPVLWPLRRAAGRPLESLAQPALRAEARGWAAGRTDRGARGVGRQRPAHDLSRGLPSLQAIRRAAVPGDRAVRGRGGDGIAFAARLSRRRTPKR